MQNLLITKHIVAKFTAEQWSLYTASHKEECVLAARALNDALEYAVNHGSNRWTTFKQVSLVMQQHSNVGAADTEPREFLYDVLDQIFPGQANNT